MISIDLISSLNIIRSYYKMMEKIEYIIQKNETILESNIINCLKVGDLLEYKPNSTIFRIIEIETEPFLYVLESIPASKEAHRMKMSPYAIARNIRQFKFITEEGDEY